MKAESASFCLRGVEEKARARITALYRERGGTFAGTFDRAAKFAMSESIFVVENDIEHEAVENGPINRRKRAIADDLRRRRNLILDDLGENELSPALLAVMARRKASAA